MASRNPSRLISLLHERMSHAPGLAAELHEPTVVHDAVDHRGSHLVVTEDGSPPRELEVGGDHERLPLVGVRDDLEQQPRPVQV